MTTPDQALASTVGRLRLERGMTQEALAFKADVAVATLRRIERGRSNPKWPTLVKIANALQITPSELLAAREGVSESRSKRT
ncbi:MAG TPA: helix-turn-helix transcriptional regulator [Solirubrobacteraceae bacterium]|jgi:transcriptional regulator with XRE-family HTH domain